jgi:hypothetical protein
MVFHTKLFCDVVFDKIEIDIVERGLIYSGSGSDKVN